MARADSNHTTPLSSLFRDAFVAAAFKAAEEDGLEPALVIVDRPRTLTGGAAEAAPIRTLEAA